MKKILLATLLAIGIVVISLTLTINRSQPSHTEIEEANLIITSLKKLPFVEMPDFLYEASREKIYINVYGLSEINDQNKVIKSINENIKEYTYQVKIHVTFFARREFVVTNSIRELKKTPLLRTVEIN